MKTQEAHGIVNKEINVILKEINKLRMGLIEIDKFENSPDSELFNIPDSEEYKKELEKLENKLKGIISQEATEIEFTERESLVSHIKSHLKDNQIVICKICGKTAESDYRRFQALKISILDLQEKIK